MDCPEVIEPCCLISEEVVAAAIKGFKIGIADGPTGVVSEMMEASVGFGTRWMTDLINHIVKEGSFLMIEERVSWCLCTRGKVIRSTWVRFIQSY